MNPILPRGPAARDAEGTIRRLLGPGLMLGLLCLLAATAWFAVRHLDVTHRLYAYFAALHDRSATGCMIVFGLGQILINACGVLPASLGAILSGMVFGLWPGFVLTSLSMMAGALIAFRLGRGMFGARILKVVGRGRGMAMVEGLGAGQGWLLVCLLRLSPVLPFAMTSYALGLSGIGTRAYLLGTLASLPSALGYVLLGHLGLLGAQGAMSGGALWVRSALMLAAGIGTVLLTGLIGRMIATTLRAEPHATSEDAC